ncbi:MAG: sulfurtransferase-like selenium metabolism protein YedF [Desulfotalea sp.]|nr:MAG: sulfurtransferase-like selenium metabolism protein YedF [Desulfotalea sp.]
MTKIINACGLACPAPVLLVKDSVEQAQEAQMTVLVDNAGSAENVSRFLTTKGYVVNEKKVDGVFRLEAARDPNATFAAEPQKSPHNTSDESQKVLVLVTSDSLGAGDDILGKKLMLSYLKTIKEMGPELWQLIFVNGGVKLTISSSPVLKELQEYEESGTIILACGTCLEHFGLTAQKQVGGTTNMLDIVTAIQLADKVVSIG